MKQIPLTRGMVALVSDHRFEYLNQWKWHAHPNKGGDMYAARKGKGNKFVFMHREIMGVTDPKTQVDHRDGDGLNNVDGNLRVCTHAQNMLNRKIHKNNTTGFKGVTRVNRKWVAYIGANSKRIHIGYFSTPVEAAKARDSKALELHGEFAKLNFEGAS